MPPPDTLSRAVGLALPSHCLSLKLPSHPMGNQASQPLLWICELPQDGDPLVPQSPQPPGRGSVNVKSEPGTQGFLLTSDSSFSSGGVVYTSLPSWSPSSPRSPSCPAEILRQTQDTSGQGQEVLPGPRLAGWLQPPGVLSQLPQPTPPARVHPQPGTQAEPWRGHSLSHTCSPALTELSKAETGRVPHRAEPQGKPGQSSQFVQGHIARKRGLETNSGVAPGKTQGRPGAGFSEKQKQDTWPGLDPQGQGDSHVSSMPAKCPGPSWEEPVTTSMSRHGN